MDVIIFFIATMLLNKTIKLWRHIVGGTLASLISCMLIVIPVLQDIPYSLYALFVPIIPVIYIYKPMCFKQFIKIYLLSFSVAAFIGGTTFSMWYISGNYDQSIQKMNVMVLIVIGLCVGMAVYFGIYFIRGLFIFPLFEYQVKLTQEGKMVKMKALMDTGNRLYTPISHKPVIVVEYRSVKPLLSIDQIRLFEKYHNKVEALIEKGVEGPKALIPFNSVGCENGILWGIEIEQLELCKTRYKKCFSKCMIGITHNPLFNDHHYEALLHPDYILEEVVG